MKKMSKRATYLMENPSYLLSREKKAVFQGNGEGPRPRLQNNPMEFSFSLSSASAKARDNCVHLFALVNGEGLLTEVYYEAEFKGSKLALLEGLFHLLQNKSRRALLGLSWREVESFLRDENHRPAFEQMEEELFSVSSAVESIVAGIYHSMSRKIGARGKAHRGPVKASRGAINILEITLVDKIKRVEKLLAEVISPIIALDGGDMKLVNIQNNVVVLKFLGTEKTILEEKRAMTFFVESVIEEYFSSQLSLQVLD